MNIFSGSRDGQGLGAALTNPTELALRKGKLPQHYPVTFAGTVYEDAEAAYQALQAQEASEDDRDLLMARIIAAKFEQHPRLHDLVTQRGGVSFLESCEHFTFAKTERFRAWEGKGRASRFIRALIAGYQRA